MEASHFGYLNHSICLTNSSLLLDLGPANRSAEMKQEFCDFCVLKQFIRYQLAFTSDFAGVNPIPINDWIHPINHIKVSKYLVIVKKNIYVE